jgi:hypothetical protein
MEWYKGVSEVEREIFREWVTDVLRKQEITVSFLKKDGELRDMRCTLQEGAVPTFVPATDRTRTLNPEVCPVFDLDKQEWRSFRFDAVTKISFTI